MGAMLSMDDVIDLVVPRGSNQLVQHIKANSRIPVLGHADGICHIYVDKAANKGMAESIVVDAKTDYPAACNAMETLLVHADYPHKTELFSALTSAGVTLYGGPRAEAECGFERAESFAIEYGELAATVELVDGL